MDASNAVMAARKSSSVWHWSAAAFADFRISLATGAAGMNWPSVVPVSVWMGGANLFGKPIIGLLIRDNGDARIRIPFQ